MTAAALALVLTAAGIHATWNFLVKRAGGGSVFTWLFTTLSVVCYAPLAAGVVVIYRPSLGPVHFLFMAGAALLHTTYYLVLTRGYRTGDLSLVYPLARGTGPMLATAAAIGLLGERPTPLALWGALLVGVGIFTLVGNLRRLRASDAPAVAYGLLTGIMIAAYTLWDKYAVSALLIPPILLIWANNLVRAVLLSPIAVRSWDTVRAEWRAHRAEALGVAVFGPLSYILILTAMVFSPVSYIAPAREISILFGTAMGLRLLAEEQAARRMVGGTAVVLGVVALALG